MKLVLLASLLFIGSHVFSQQSKFPVPTLDSVDCANKATMQTFVIGTKIEALASFERNRLNEEGNFKPLALTFNVFLPFEFQFGRLYRPTEEKLIKINVVAFLHTSIQGNYGIGFAPRLSFLLFKHCYLSYQLGLGWFEVTNPLAKDGLTNRGLNFHHQVAISYLIDNHWSIDIHVLHTSNGRLFSNMTNVQDGIGIGVGYQIRR